MALVCHPRTGIAISAVFLVCNAVYLILDLAIPWLRRHFRDNTGLKNWMTITQYLAMPFLIVLLGAILVPFLLLGKPDRDESCKEDEIEADIAGLGIRITAWAQICVLLFVALLGTFHNRTTIAKEVGAGLVVTYLSLVIGLLLQQEGTNLISKFLGCMILDAQNNALSIPLVTKETLAARWQVMVTVVCQSFGLVILGIFVNGFGNGGINNPTCPCLPAAWWGGVGVCTESTAPNTTLVRNKMRAFWIYYAFRWLLLFQSSFHSLRNMVAFHEAEKDRRNSSRLEDITFPPLYLENESFLRRLFLRQHSPTYERYTATVSLAFLVYAMFAIVSMAAAENLLGDIDINRHTEEVSFGQAVAIVVAAATIGRAIWLASRSLYKHRGEVFHSRFWRRDGN